MLFHVDMSYLVKQAKCDVEKKLYFEMRTVTKSNPEQDFFSFCQNEESMQMFCKF